MKKIIIPLLEIKLISLSLFADIFITLKLLLISIKVYAIDIPLFKILSIFSLRGLMYRYQSTANQDNKWLAVVGNLYLESLIDKYSDILEELQNNN